MAQEAAWTSLSSPPLSPKVPWGRHRGSRWHLHSGWRCREQHWTRGACCYIANAKLDWFLPRTLPRPSRFFTANRTWEYTRGESVYLLKCTRIFVAVFILFLLSQDCEPLKRPSIVENLSELRCIPTWMKRNELLVHKATWMNLTNIRWNDRFQIQTMYSVLFHLYTLEKQTRPQFTETEGRWKREGSWR